MDTRTHTAEELCQLANEAITKAFGWDQPRITRGPSNDIPLYLVSWKQDGQNHGVRFKHKKNAEEFYKKCKADFNGQAGFMKQKYDCDFIYEEGIESCYLDYEIQDMTLKEFEKYIKQHMLRKE